MDPPHHDEPAGRSWRYWPRWSRAVWVVFMAAGLVVASLVSATTFKHGTKSPIPQSVSEKALFDVYFPARLPEGYSLDAESYHNVDGALVFSASNAGGRVLAITETARPKDYDMDAFNKSLGNVKKFAGTPHTSVVGKMPGRGTVLSITTDTTWIIISSQLELPERDARLIAEHLRK